MKSQQPLSASVGAALGHGPSDLGMVLAGGGARAAYQVGFLRHLAQHAPDLQIPYIHGVSAGAINAAIFAAEILALSDDVVREAVLTFRSEQSAATFELPGAPGH